jgi:DNA helicase II / ATP-dependent DNA helicase PcrA
MPEKATTQTYNKAFLREFERLNPAQREAVERIEGPVLVIAGPGTGKTHILAARIGRILMETDAQPYNILCLTFTDAGVQAMRQRLLELIGPEGHRVHIFTFHSFCNTIIQDNIELFGRRDLEPLSDLERVEILRRLLDELPLQHPLVKGRSNIYFYENHLQNLFRQMKSENWTVEFVDKKIKEYLEGLPNREEFIYKRKQGQFKKGDVKIAKLEDEQDKMERLRSAVALFPRFEKLMQEARRYDYEDMILWVLRAFRDFPALLARYQEQYLYFLVDEYQDTNGAQNEVLHRLFEYWESPNVFIVGDDDQSIYEFQGARLKNLTDFYDNYREGLKLVILKENYRSSQHILDTSGALIRQNKIRIVHNLKELGIEKILTARHEEFAGVHVRPTVAEYPSRLNEEVDIVSQIEQLMQDGFPLDEVAVIFAKHRQARRLMELLAKKGIPFRTRRSTNILDLPLIQNLRTLLEYLHAEHLRPYSGEHLLFRIMHFDFFKIPPHDLARLALAIAPDAKSNKGKPPLWRNLIADRRFLKKIKPENPDAIADLSGFLEFMLGEYANLSLPAFVERLINRSGLLRNVLDGEEKEWLIQVLFTFTSFIQKETDRNPRLTLARLLEIFKNMDANRIQLAVSSPQSNHQSPVSSHQSPVNLVTAHGSKGLEFQKVFLLDCVKDNWEPNNRTGGYQFPFPDTLTLSGEADAEEARRRLFYVAMTRAKESLHISYAVQDDDEKGLQRAVYIDEILADTQVEVQPKAAGPAAVLEAQATLLLEVKPTVAQQDREAVQALLENFTLSVSSMNKYLRCPLSFYFENVLRVPVLASESAYFGLAMHDALQLGFEKMLRSRGERKFPPVKDFVWFFENKMRQFQGFFSKKEFDRRMELGRLNLENYVGQKIANWPKNVEVEKEIRNVELDGVPLTGVIDRLEFREKLDAHILDYKTGSHDAAKMKGPTEKKPQGSNYWLQLHFYKILYENWRNNSHRIVSGEISYLDPDGKGEFPSRRIVFQPEDVLFVKNLIKDTYGKIMRQEFYEGCGEPNCSWCSFLKHQERVDTFAEEEIEELDD